MKYKTFESFLYEQELYGEKDWNPDPYGEEIWNPDEEKRIEDELKLQKHERVFDVIATREIINDIKNNFNPDYLDHRRGLSNDGRFINDIFTYNGEQNFRLRRTLDKESRESIYLIRINDEMRYLNNDEAGDLFNFFQKEM